MPAPTLAVVRRFQQTIDDAFVSVGTMVGQIGVQFVDRRRQADQIQANASQQCRSVRLRRWRDILLLEFGQDESVDRIADPLSMFNLCGRRALDRLKRPMVGTGSGMLPRGVIWPVRATIDPSAQQTDLLARSVARLHPPAACGRYLCRGPPRDGSSGFSSFCPAR